jgi:hypothetical protein
MLEVRGQIALIRSRDTVGHQRPRQKGRKSQCWELSEYPQVLIINNSCSSISTIAAQS